MKLESVPTVLDFDPFVQSSSTTAGPNHGFGEPVYLADGRVFRYARSAAGSSKGKLQLAPAHDTALDNLTVAAAAIGATKVTVTPGATTAAAGAFDEGYMVVNDNDGEGQTYKIKNNPAIASATAFTLELFDPISVALTSSSQVCLVHNTYNNVVEGSSTTAQPAGVPLKTLTTGYFGWLQTRGVASVLCGTTGSLGAMGIAAATGAVTDMTDVTAPETEYWVGRFIVAGVSTEYRPFFLMID
jgi:hypothetical protein